MGTNADLVIKDCVNCMVIYKYFLLSQEIMFYNDFLIRIQFTFMRFSWLFPQLFYGNFPENK